MSDWLVFYNTELPHLSTKPHPKKTASLNNLPVPPVEYLLKSHPHSSMYWTNKKWSGEFEQGDKWTDLLI